MAHTATTPAPSVENLTEALTTCRVISTAVGIVMHQSGLDHEEAFDHPVDTSQRTNAKLALIAGDVVAQANARVPRGSKLAGT